MVEEAGNAGVMSLVGTGNGQGGREVGMWLGTGIRMGTRIGWTEEGVARDGV